MTGRPWLDDGELSALKELVETFDRCGFDHLELSAGDLRLVLGKGEAATAAAPAPVVEQREEARKAAEAPAAVRTAPVPPPAAGKPKPRAGNGATPGEGEVGIAAPLMGVFYARPQPGAAPFMSVGAQVEAGATIGLIETMKVFNAVPAAASGKVVAICVEDAQSVASGQLLAIIRPEA